MGVTAFVSHDLGESPCRHAADLPPHYKYYHAHYIVNTVHIWCSSSFVAHLNLYSPSRKLFYSIKYVILLQHTMIVTLNCMDSENTVDSELSAN
jgi:hypothetical protein